MTLSEIYYEAACEVSSSLLACFSCIAVQSVGGVAARDQYAALMNVESFYAPEFVEKAALEVGWGKNEYRTFMLLMASEAVKC